MNEAIWVTLALSMYFLGYWHGYKRGNTTERIFRAAVRVSRRMVAERN